MDAFPVNDIPIFFENFAEIVTISGNSVLCQIQKPEDIKNNGAFFDFDFILYMKTADIETYKLNLYPNRVVNINARLYIVQDRFDNLGITELKIRKKETT